MKRTTLHSLISREPFATVAARVAPEDLRRGDYVAVLNHAVEFPSFFWCLEGDKLDPREVVRLNVQSRDGGIPLKIRATCLPFVLLKTHEGRVRTADVRQMQFVRLDRGYARLVWKKLRKQATGAANLAE